MSALVPLARPDRRTVFFFPHALHTILPQNL